MQLRDAVRVLRRAERERREPEALVARLDLAEREEVLPRQSAALDESFEIAPHELRVEHLVAGRHRRVCREHGRRAQPLERFGGRQLLLLDELAHPFELEKGRVSLVQVEDRGVEAEATQHAHAADAEHELLAQPVLAVAAVEDVRDVARPRGIALDLRVEEIERDAADPHAPDAEPHRHEIAVVVGELDDRSHRHELQRQAARIVAWVALDLPVLLVELLPEVPAAVEEADPDEWDAELRRRLEVVAGEDAEPAGVDGEALVEPELRGEVGDEEIGGAAPAAPPRVLAVVAGEACLDPREPLEIVRREDAGQVLVGQLGQERGRVVVKLGEPAGLEVHEEPSRLRDPREGEVAGDLEECRAQPRAVVYLRLRHEAAP